MRWSFEPSYYYLFTTNTYYKKAFSCCMKFCLLVRQDVFLVLKEILSRYQVQLAFSFHLITGCQILVQTDLETIGKRSLINFSWTATLEFWSMIPDMTFILVRTWTKNYLRSDECKYVCTCLNIGETWKESTVIFNDPSVGIKTLLAADMSHDFCSQMAYLYYFPMCRIVVLFISNYPYQGLL